MLAQYFFVCRLVLPHLASVVNFRLSVIDINADFESRLVSEDFAFAGPNPKLIVRCHHSESPPVQNLLTFISKLTANKILSYTDKINISAVILLRSVYLDLRLTFSARALKYSSKIWACHLTLQ